MNPALLAVALLAPIPQTDTAREEYAYTIGVQAYIYGFPVYEMYRTRQQAVFGPLAQGRTMNRFQHRRQLLGPEARAVVSPNTDTLYSSAWLDLKDGPLLLETPDTEGRYYCLQFMDFFTNNFAYVGRRTTGTKAGKYLVAGPGWKGSLPPGASLIQSPTNSVWLLGRFLVQDEADLPSVHRLQDQLKLTPLGGAPPTVRAAPPAPEPGDELSFFRILNLALAENPPPPGEGALLALFARIGIGPQAAGDWDEATRRGLRRAVAAGRDIIRGRTGQRDTLVNGWNVWRSTKIGRYGDDYLLRAAIAMAGLAANDREENTSSVARTDAAGEPLDGSRRYVMRFDKDGLPPVDAFWSLTLYDSSYFLVANPIRRYAIGDRTKGLKTGADGSLEIYIQRESPGADKESNWLPAPAGAFYLALRCYQPRRPILEGTYAPPPVRRVEEPPERRLFLVFLVSWW